MRVYVAGSHRELERVERMHRELEDRGCEVTHKWTEDVRDAQDRGMTDRDLSLSEAQRIAAQDYAAIERADVFVLLVPARGGTGCWCELGYAQYQRRKVRLKSGLQRPWIVVVEIGRRRTPFEALVDLVSPSDIVAAGSIADWAGGEG